AINIELPSRIGRLLCLGGFPLKLTLSSLGSNEIVLFTGSDAFQALLIVIPDRLLSAGFISRLRLQQIPQTLLPYQSRLTQSKVNFLFQQCCHAEHDELENV